MQFWQDVDAGLEGIERFYRNQKNQDIDRIKEFCLSSQGLLPPPQGSATGHEPSEEHVNGLTSQPYWDTAQHPELFPWAAALEASADIIQCEFREKLLNSNQPFAADSAWQNQVMGTGWSAVRLQRLGVWNTEICREFPATYELLRSLNIPLAVRGVCFARQAAGSGVQPHSDGRNFILTSHLGLSIPVVKGESCWIEVGGERRGWQEGKLTTLDTSFTHCTGNPTDQDRHVLILDFWHPELTAAERAALEFIYDLRNQFESGAIPYRTPKALLAQQGNNAFGNWWKSVTAGGS